MNKFEKSLAIEGNEIYKKRVNLVCNQLKNEQRKLVDELKEKISEVEMKMLELVDIGPDSSVDIRPGGKNFDPKKWRDDMQELKLKKIDLKVQLTAAEETNNEWFTEE